MGFDPQIDYPFKVRMVIQNRILDAAESLYKKYTDEFVTDRTPIDMLAYTMADIQRENLDSDDEAIFIDYQKRCFDITNRHFAVLIIVQPGIPLVADASKAPINKAYIEHINSLIIGLSADQRINTGKFFMNRDTIELERRCDALDYAVERFHANHVNKMQMEGIVPH